MSRSFEELVEPYGRDVQALALAARRALTAMLPDATEMIDPSAAVVSYGYGTGYKGMVCTLILSKAGVKLGIVNGATLPDPDKILEGGGKTHKYVPLRNAEDLARPAVRRIVEEARAAGRRVAGDR